MALADTAQPAKHWLKDAPTVTHGTPAHADLLAVGYQMTVEEAQEIISARAKNPSAYSIAEVRKAEALVAALKAKPVVSATRPMWKRPLSG